PAPRARRGPAGRGAQYYRRTFSAAELALDPGPALRAIREAAGACGRVFLDLDCDVFDPAFFPAVCQPVPFGLAPQQVLRLLDAAWSGGVAGLVVSEVDPRRDQQDRSLATLVGLGGYPLLRRVWWGPPGPGGPPAGGRA